MKEQGMREGLLSPYRILDLTDEKGLFCGKLLGDLGADVIKIEKPGGDSARNFGPFFHDDPHLEKSLYWFAFNTNKRGITLDIERRDGLEIFKRLLKTADAVVESFKPGFMEKLGLDYSELKKVNPRIILTSITPFGQTGPYKDYKGADIVCWALSGKLLLTGDPDRAPVPVSHVPHGWLHGSADGAVGTMMALYRRARSGEGQHIDVSMQASLEKVGHVSHLMWTLLHREGWRGSVHRTPPSQTAINYVWPCKDGYILFFPFSGPLGPLATGTVVEFMDREGMADDFIRKFDWASLDWGCVSQEEADRLQEYFIRFFKTKTKAELFNEAIKKDLLIQPVFTPKDLLEHPQLHHRDYWQKVEHRELSQDLTYPGGFLRSSETICKIWRQAPLIGEHNVEIYEKELGLTRESLTALKQSGAI
ncbi:MAG: CoA transferase [Deltaproteobacteria bacterium]|nr:CoA transferase [Deltaproteobacteria bacterium]